MRQYVGMAVAGTLLLAAGFGLYWVLDMGRGGDGTVRCSPPTRRRSRSRPIRRPPPRPTPARSPVLDEIDGVDRHRRQRDAGLDRRDDRDRRRRRQRRRGPSKSGLANRKVRTVTVRPDGTIVSGDDAVAGSEALPVERPNVPEVPGDAATATDVLANAAEGVAQDPIAAVIANPDAAPTTPPTRARRAGDARADAGQPRSEHPHPDAADR